MSDKKNSEGNCTLKMQKFKFSVSEFPSLKIFSNCYFFNQFQPRCSYKFVIKKRVVSNVHIDLPSLNIKSASKSKIKCCTGLRP